MRILVQVDASDVTEGFRKDAVQMNDLRAVWRKGGTVMRRSFAENFRQGGRPDKWAPLSPNTIASKQMHGYALRFPYSTRRGVRRIRRLEQNGVRELSNILIAGGQLRDSYVQKNANHVSRVSLEGFEEGSKHFLAEFHEDGTRPYVIRPKNAPRLSFWTSVGRVAAMKVNHPGLPARPVGIVQPEDEDAILDLLMRHLDGDTL